MNGAARVGGDRQQLPARAGTVAAHVVDQRALSVASCRPATPRPPSPAACFRPGGRERALDRGEPRGGRVGGGRDEQQAERERERRRGERAPDRQQRHAERPRRPPARGSNHSM